jgi:hypothetical protein
MKPDRRTDFSTATRGYNDALERAAADAIATTIATASVVTVAALVTTLASVLALTPAARSPTTLRHAVDDIAKRLRRKAAAAVADPVVRDFKTRGCFDGTGTRGQA